MRGCIAIYLLGRNKCLIRSLARNKSLLSVKPKLVCLFSVPAPISEDFPDTKMMIFVCHITLNFNCTCPKTRFYLNGRVGWGDNILEAITDVLAPILLKQVQSSTGFNTEHENTCPFPCHIDSSIPTYRDMCSQLIV